MKSLLAYNERDDVAARNAMMSEWSRDLSKPIRRQRFSSSVFPSGRRAAVGSIPILQ